MKRPSFQFYPGDWRQNANLRRCSPAARGIWMDVMCLLHDSEEYGLLRWPLKDIASAAGASMPNLRELVTKGVLKGDDKAVTVPFIYTPISGRKEGASVTLVGTQDGPVWYSSRMVKDEYVRTVRGENTRFSGDKDDAGDVPKATSKPALKPSPKPPFGDGSSSSSSSSPSGNTPKAPKGAGLRFEEFWTAWPKGERKQDRKKCHEKWISGDLDEVGDAILADIEVKRGTEKWREGYIEAPVVYLNNRRWEDGGGASETQQVSFV